MELRACVDALKPQLLSTLRQNIQIPSAHGEAEDGAPYGASVRDSLVHVLDTARKLGFRTENMDGHLGWCEYGEGDEMVAVLGHLDVVPAGDGWSCDPFGGELRDGKIWGRGTTDDKGPAIASLFALAPCGIPDSPSAAVSVSCSAATRKPVPTISNTTLQTAARYPSWASPRTANIRSSTAKRALSM